MTRHVILALIFGAIATAGFRVAIAGKPTYGQRDAVLRAEAFVSDSITPNNVLQGKKTRLVDGRIIEITHSSTLGWEVLVYQPRTRNPAPARQLEGLYIEATGSAAPSDLSMTEYLHRSHAGIRNVVVHRLEISRTTGDTTYVGRTVYDRAGKRHSIAVNRLFRSSGARGARRLAEGRYKYGSPTASKHIHWDYEPLKGDSKGVHWAVIPGAKTIGVIAAKTPDVMVEEATTSKGVRQFWNAVSKGKRPGGFRGSQVRQFTGRNFDLGYSSHASKSGSSRVFSNRPVGNGRRSAK